MLLYFYFIFLKIYFCICYAYVSHWTRCESSKGVVSVSLVFNEMLRHQGYSWHLIEISHDNSDSNQCKKNLPKELSKHFPYLISRLCDWACIDYASYGWIVAGGFATTHHTFCQIYFYLSFGPWGHRFWLAINIFPKPSLFLARCSAYLKFLIRGLFLVGLFAPSECVTNGLLMLELCDW